MTINELREAIQKKAAESAKEELPSTKVSTAAKDTASKSVGSKPLYVGEDVIKAVKALESKGFANFFKSLGINSENLRNKDTLPPSESE